ncbi:MAG: alpha/beta hydrolase, partial [Caulobacteraceae bacterium]
MQGGHKLIKLAAVAGFAALMTGGATSKPVRIPGTTCEAPPVMHCPDKDCPGATVIDPGAVIEPKTGRKFFLDYPCDLKPGEKVVFVLSLHGGGSYGNWQRHYFPIMDYKDKYRLVIATPNAPPRVWAAVDDEYLQNITTMVYEQFGKANIKAFWLAGHSQGGMTSNRIICTDFFKGKVDGWLSLSGGRIGPMAPPAPSFFQAVNPAGAAAPAGGPPRPTEGALAAPRGVPACDFSSIYETGERELGAPFPETSVWANKYACAPRVRREDIVDTKPGYVYDSTRQ